MNVNINNNEVERYVKSVSNKTGEPVDLIMNKMLERDMKAAQYRARRNATQWAQTKALKEHAAELELKVAAMEARATGASDEDIEAALQELASQQ